MSQLVRYEAACLAISECKAVDEVKAWADKAAAMQAYGRMAQDRTMEVDAAEIRIRAERRLGQLIAAQKADGGLNSGAAGTAGPGRGNKNALVTNEGVLQAPKLADAGISYDLSSRAQKLAAVPEPEFEGELAAKRERDAQDGARVSAKLQAIGAKRMQAALQRVEPDHGPDDAEIAAAEAAQTAMVNELYRLADADDKLAEAFKTIERLTALVESQRMRINGLTNENGELIREVKKLRNRLTKVAA